MLSSSPLRRMTSQMLPVIAVLIAVCMFVAGARATHAAMCTFTGAVSADFNTSGNWDCGVVPGNGDEIDIPPATSTTMSANVTVSTTTVDGTLNLGGFDLTSTSTVTSIHVTKNGTLTVGSGTASASGTISNSGTINLNSGTIRLEGDWTDPGTFNPGTGLVDFVGSGAQQVTEVTGFADVKIDSNGGIVTLAGETTSTGSVEVHGGIFALNGNTIHVGSAWNNSGGTLSPSNGTVDFDTAGGTMSITHGEANFANVSVTAASGTLNVLGNVTSTGNFTINAGTVNLGSYRLELTGNWSDTGTLNGGTSNVVFVGSGAQTIGAEPHFYDMTFNSTRGVATLTGNVTSTHNVIITSGTFALGTHTVFVGGDWRDAGTLDGGTGTVVLNGSAQTVSGNSTFYNLTKQTSSADTLTFTGVSTQTITNTLTLEGASGNLLSLRSSVSGTQWLISPQRTRTINYVDVKDSNNRSGVTISLNVANHSVDSGNNTDWTFDNAAPTIVLTSNASSYTTLSSFTVTSTFSEAVSGFSIDDITIGNGVASAFTTSSSSVYTFDVTPTAEGAVTIDIATSSAFDVALNPNDAAPRLTIVYDVTAPGAPTASPSAGTYTASQSVTLASTDGTATIRYTTDGTTPTCSHGTVYASAVTVGTSMTFQTIACDRAGNASGVSTIAFTININTGGGGSGSPGSVGLPPVVTTFQTSGNGAPAIYIPFSPTADTAALLANFSAIGVPVHGLIKLQCADGAEVNDPCKAVYYLGIDGKRHAFPNDKVFFTWYDDFSQVKIVSAGAMASIPLGKNATDKPGVRMVKFTSDAKVYVLSKGGILHWVTTEALASALYGSAWNTNVDDINDAFHGDYGYGTDITATSAYDPAAERASVTTLSDSLRW